MWKTTGRWTRKLNGVLVSLARDDKRPGCTVAFMLKTERANIDDLRQAIGNEFPGARTMETTDPILGDDGFCISFDAFN